MLFAAARPDAKASRHGDARPKFIAAIKMPKNTCGDMRCICTGQGMLCNPTNQNERVRHYVTLEHAVWVFFFSIAQQNAQKVHIYCVFEHTWMRSPGESSLVSMTNLEPYQKARA